jgi:hypothetical protein
MEVKMYNFNSSYVKHCEIFSSQEKATLHELANDIPLDVSQSDTRTSENAMIDCLYSLAVSMGSMYSYRNIESLAFDDRPAEGKTLDDTMAVKGLVSAYLQAMDTETDKVLGVRDFKEMNYAVMQYFGYHRRPGVVRNHLSELGLIAETAGTFEDPFDRAAYLHCAIYGLRPFHEGNGLTARFVQMASMVSSRVIPPFCRKQRADEWDATLHEFCKTGSYTAYRKFFLDAYRKDHDSIVRYLSPGATFRGVWKCRTYDESVDVDDSLVYG